MLLNVLLLEDDPAKKGRLLGFIESKKGELFGEADTALCVQDALKLLSSKKYDLLMVDVIVPTLLGGEAHEDHSIELFRQLDENHHLHRPRFSIALSGSSELSETARGFFVGRPWGILKYEDSHNECLQTLEKIARFIIDTRSRARPTKEVDIFLLTALNDPEFFAVEAISFDWSPLEPLDENQFIRYGKLSTTNGEKTIGAAFSPRMGPIESAIVTTKALLKLQPKFVIMGGMCAGIDGKAGIGDVVAADISWDWQSGKYTDKFGNSQFEIAPDQISVDEEIRSQLMLFKRNNLFWMNLGAVAAQYSQKTPKLVIGPMASGSSVLADARVSDRIKSTQHRNLTGLDMETYGVYAAVRACSRETRVLSMKAVCDKGDLTKNDEYQNYACRISALAIEHFLKEHIGALL